jgi:hypothetical protein
LPDGSTSSDADRVAEGVPSDMRAIDYLAKRLKWKEKKDFRDEWAIRP